jgi:hypothetical protein
VRQPRLAAQQRLLILLRLWLWLCSCTKPRSRRHCLRPAGPLLLVGERADVGAAGGRLRLRCSGREPRAASSADAHVDAHRVAVHRGWCGGAGTTCCSHCCSTCACRGWGPAAGVGRCHEAAKCSNVRGQQPAGGHAAQRGAVHRVHARGCTRDWRRRRRCREQLQLRWLRTASLGLRGVFWNHRT